MQDTELPEKITPTSLNFQTELAAQLAEIVPEVLSDGKLDVTKLRELLNGDAENSPEKFGLFWPGKRAAQALAQIPTTATLVPAPEESVDWDNTKNIFIEGDNLEVLKALQNSYRRKVKMIYIDPPYNTGKEFIYPDKFSEGLQGYLEYTGQKNEAGENVESKQETGGRKHSNWLNMMYPRLQLAKSLLVDDGLIFISIDNHEQSNLKKLCDEVFGEENFVNSFAWINNLKGRQISGYGAAGTNEYILCYARSIEQAEEFKASASLLKTLMPSTYKGFDYTVKNDEHGPYITKNELYNSNSIFNETTRPNLVFDIYYHPETKDIKTSDVSEDYIFDGYVKIIPKINNNGQNKFHAYRWSRKKIISEPYNLEFVKSGDSYKIYTKIRDIDSTTAKDVITDINTTHGSADISGIGFNSKYFDFPKPVRLIEFLLMIGSHKDSLIVDFFSGSGTTAHAIMRLNAEDGGNRQHIQVQLPELLDIKSEPYKAGFKTIADISKERIRYAGKKINEDYADKIIKRSVPLDNGFRVYKLAPSNFVQWDENKAKDDIQQAVLDFATNKKLDATPEALLTEIMLQARMPLNANIEKRDLQNSGWIYVVDGGNLIAYVANEQISESQANEIADLAPAKLIVLDSAFNGNNALKINVANICKEKFIKEFKTI
jgi:adenine-specific DNA-methyltransferase